MGNEVKKKRIKKKKVIKAPKIQTIFSIVSIVFILACCIFYGTRLVKYYKIYNPKSETGESLINLGTGIISNSPIVYEGDGLYINSGNYIYKGENVNNYILVNNMIFRIIKINNDKTIDIVLDEYINKLNWDLEIKEFKDTYISEYLNQEFLSILDTDILNKTSVCTNQINAITEVNCDNFDTSNYVRLLSLNDFFNSMNEEKTYLSRESEFLWLHDYSETKVWNISSFSVSSSEPSKMYGIKPVVTLKNSLVLTKGDGTLANPYQIQEDDKIKVGTYLDINDDIYIVYEEGDNYYKIQSNNLIKNIEFDSKSNNYQESGLKEYLETIYLDSLTFKDLLTEIEWNGIKTKINILSINDFKFNSSLKNYYLIDTKDKEVYLYNGTLLSSKVNTKRNVRPCLSIKKDLKIISGNGSKLAPFIVEV